MAERARVGNVEIAAALDADFRLAPTVFLPQSPPEAWKPFIGDADPAAELEARVMTYVVRSQGRTILVDSGVGDWDLWRFGKGHLLDSLRELGLTPEDIDVVLPTHLHVDHVGWNTRPSPNGPVPTFPRARYLFQQLDWDHFTGPGFLENPNSRPTAVEMVQKAVLPLENTGLMELIGHEEKITDEVTLLHTPGHTPGSVTVLVQSGGEAALLLGDVAHHPAQLTETEWTPAIDVDASLSARSRKAVVERAQKLNALVAAGHFNAPGEPAFGHMLQIDGRPMWRGVTLPG